MMLESLVVKWSVRKAGKVGYKAGRAFGEECVGVPSVITDSVATYLTNWHLQNHDTWVATQLRATWFCPANKWDAFKEIGHGLGWQTSATVP